MPSTHTATKPDRLEARISAELKALLVRAAELNGQSLTDFVVGAAAAAARGVVRDSEQIAFSERDQMALAHAIVNPPTANAALQAAADRYRSRQH